MYSPSENLSQRMMILLYEPKIIFEKQKMTVGKPVSQSVTTTQEGKILISLTVCSKTDSMNDKDWSYLYIFHIYSRLFFQSFMI